MLSIRENYLIAARGGKPEWVPTMNGEVNRFMPSFWREIDPETGVDFCNLKWVTDEFGRMPDERWKAMEHVSQWRETIKFPDLSKMDWEGIQRTYQETRDPEKVDVAVLNTHGMFLIPVNMLGWIDALTAIYTDREELVAFVTAITDFLVELCGYLVKYIKPDIISSGDDLSSAKGPFISKEVWEEIYKPQFVRISEAIKAGGALFEFHNCGSCGYLIEEFLNIGVDICQLPAKDADLLRDKERFGNRLVITGGWDRHGIAAMPGATEEEVRQSVRDGIDTWGKDGALIFWDGGIAGKGEDSLNKIKWVYDELNKYKFEVYA